MNRELAAILASSTHLVGRVTEVSNRLRQDALLLLELQQELSRCLERAWYVAEEPARRALRPSSDGPRMLRLSEVIERVGLSRSSIYNMVRDRRFPQPRQLGTHAVRWLDVEIDSGCWRANSRPVRDGRHRPGEVAPVILHVGWGRAEGFGQPDVRVLTRRPVNSVA